MIRQNSSYTVPSDNSYTSAQPNLDEKLLRVFNTALISTVNDAPKDVSKELQAVIQSPAFKAILNATRQLAVQSGVDERTAAEQIIRTFRQVDEIWRRYVFQEGIERLRNNKQGGTPA